MVKNQNKENSTSRKTSLINLHDVEETPFTVVEETEKKEFIVVIGNQRVAQKTFKSLEEAENYINSKPWELIVNATCVFMQKLDEIKYLKDEKN